MAFPVVAVLSAIVAPIGEWLAGVTARRRIKEEGKVRVAIAQAEAEVKRAETEAEYDNLAQRQMQFSWKDEYLVIVFTIPLIFSFLSPFIDFVLLITMEEAYTFTDKIPAAWQAVSLSPRLVSVVPDGDYSGDIWAEVAMEKKSTSSGKVKLFLEDFIHRYKRNKNYGHHNGKKFTRADWDRMLKAYHRN